MRSTALGAHVVVAFFGSPLGERPTPWMDGLMQFVQVDESGRPEPLEGEPEEAARELTAPWSALRERGIRLLGVRS